jgi:hypothetical protein
LPAFDLAAKRVTDGVNVGVDPDAPAIDAGLRRVDRAAESGVVTVVRRDRSVYARPC